MRATPKLVNAIMNGSIVAEALMDGPTSGLPPKGRRVYSNGGLDWDYVIDPVGLTIRPLVYGGSTPASALAVFLPDWTRPKFPWVLLDFNFNVLTFSAVLAQPGVPGGIPPVDAVALGTFAAAGYFA